MSTARDKTDGSGQKRGDDSGRKRCPNRTPSRPPRYDPATTHFEQASPVRATKTQQRSEVNGPGGLGKDRRAGFVFRSNLRKRRSRSANGCVVRDSTPENASAMRKIGQNRGSSPKHDRRAKPGGWQPCDEEARGNGILPRRLRGLIKRTGLSSSPGGSTADRTGRPSPGNRSKQDGAR